MSRVFETTPEAVYGVLQLVLPDPAYGLVLAETSGGDPLDGGVLTFDVPSFYATGVGAPNRAFAYEMAWCDVKQVRVRLGGLARRDDVCEVTLVAPLAHSRRLNFWFGAAFAGAGAGVTGVLAVTVAGVLAGGALTALPAAALMAASGLGAGGAAGGAVMRGFRALYRYALRRGERALTRLLQQVDVALRTGGAFAPGRSVPPSLRGAGAEPGARA